MIILFALRQSCNLLFLFKTTYLSSYRRALETGIRFKGKGSSLAYPVDTPNTLPIVLRSIFNYYIQCLWCGNRISTVQVKGNILKECLASPDFHTLPAQSERCHP